MYSFIEIYQQAMDLYGLIHARFILSPRGLAYMREKYLLGEFGSCPRVMCKRQYVLPIGVSEELNSSRVKIYCPKCRDVYVPRNGAIDIDGAYFTTSFPQAFFQAFPDLQKNVGPEKYIPKIYGFKVFSMPGSKYEYIFDEKGNPANDKEVTEILECKKTDYYQQMQSDNFDMKLGSKDVGGTTKEEEDWK